MKPADALLVSQLCAARAGLKIDPDKLYLMEARLAPVARRDGFGSIDDMLIDLRNCRDERLIWAVVEAMAVGETSFFRDREVFDRFRDVLLPAAAKAREGGAVRVWSAACGSGQEIYSLAMLVDEYAPAGARVELYGSDIAEAALEKAQSGLYTQFEVQRGLPARRLVRHFDKVDDMWALSPKIRQMVRWRRINLIGDLSKLGQFDIIYCRYMLGSLVEPMQARVLESLAQVLAPSGVLVLGEGEDPSALTIAVQASPTIPGALTRNPAFSVAA